MTRDIQGLICDRHDTESFQTMLRQVRHAGRLLVFTNGCFDVLTPSHVALLNYAKKSYSRGVGDSYRESFVLVGLNSDASVRRLKGASRPLLTWDHRAQMLFSLKPVDAVVGFGRGEPQLAANDFEELELLIASLKPDVLVKGGDWSSHRVAGEEGMIRRDKVVDKLFRYAGAPSTTDLVTTVRDKLLAAANQAMRAIT